MEIMLDSQIVNLVSSLETDLTKVIHEALAIWLKERLTVCPITKQFCTSTDGPCNDCAVTQK